MRRVSVAYGYKFNSPRSRSEVSVLFFFFKLKSVRNLVLLNVTGLECIAGNRPDPTGAVSFRKEKKNRNKPSGNLTPVSRAIIIRTKKKKKLFRRPTDVPISTCNIDSMVIRENIDVFD